MSAVNSGGVIIEGWLKKKGQKRWFVLKDDSVLYWFQKEQKTASVRTNDMKGCLELEGCKLTKADKPSYSFTVSNVETLNYYTLTANDADTAELWYQAIDKAIERANRNSKETKRGVLKKKGKERLFVLNATTLTWFLNEGEKKAKGSLALTGANVCPGSKPYSIKITPAAGKVYELGARNQSECDDWLSAIEKGIDRSAQQFERQVEGSKAGWLDKKGKKRYFVCRGGKLLWYTKSVAADSNEEANNYLVLSACQVRALPPNTKTGEYPFEVTGPHGDRYVLGAASEGECSAWLSFIARQRESLANPSGPTQKKKKKKKPEDAPSPESAISSITPVPNSPPIRSALPSSNSTPIGEGRAGERGERSGAGNHVGGTSLPSSPSSPAALLAAAVTGNAAEAPPPLPPREAGAPPMLPQAPPPPRRPAGRATSRREPSDKIPSEKDRNSSEKDKNSNDKDRSSTLVEGNTSARAAKKKEGAVKEGWLEKKGKRRWFVLESGRLMWFNAPRKRKTDRGNGSVVVADVVCAELRDGKLGFAFWTALDEYVVMATSGQEVKDWMAALTAHGGRAQEELPASMRASSKPASTVRKQEMKVETKIHMDHHGWLEKKGKSRWFMLCSQRLLWFNVVQVTDRTPANGLLDVNECRVRRIDESVRGKFPLYVYSKLDASHAYLLLAPSREEAIAWVDALLDPTKGGAELDPLTVLPSKKEQKEHREVKDKDDTKRKSRREKSTRGTPMQSAGGGGALVNMNEELSDPLVYGVPLGEHLSRAQREGNVPLLVERCVGFIMAHGMESEGIFRLSGDSTHIAVLKRRWDMGEAMVYEEDEDVNAVAGLLKLYLREMPEPLVPFDRYEAVVALGDIKDPSVMVGHLKPILYGLPTEHYILLAYLMRFANQIARHSAVNLMKPMNLSIVLGPNLLRTREATMAMLANSSKILMVTKVMIECAFTLFPDSFEE